MPATVPAQREQIAEHHRQEQCGDGGDRQQTGLAPGRRSHQRSVVQDDARARRKQRGVDNCGGDTFERAGRVTRVLAPKGRGIALIGALNPLQIVQQVTVEGANLPRLGIPVAHGSLRRCIPAPGTEFLGAGVDWDGNAGHTGAAGVTGVADSTGAAPVPS